MSRLDVKDISFFDLMARKYDMCIFGSGYEKRARFFLSKIYKAILPSIPIKRCFVFNDYRDLPERLINDGLFSKNNFSFMDVDKFNYGEISYKISQILNENQKVQSKKINILIDYTVMRRAWYSELLQLFSILSDSGCQITATFVYTNGSYMGEKQLKIVDDYILVPGFEGVGSQKKEKYGIYSLGFEPISVQSLHDWVEPRTVTCIIASPGSKPGSRDMCYKLNKNFLQSNVLDVVETPISNVRLYCNLVTDIIKSQSEVYDIVLFGGGPKPFILGNFLCSMLRPMVSNIYLKGPESDPINVESTGSMVITEVSFLP